MYTTTPNESGSGCGFAWLSFASSVASFLLNIVLFLGWLWDTAVVFVGDGCGGGCQQLILLSLALSSSQPSLHRSLPTSFIFGLKTPIIVGIVKQVTAQLVIERIHVLNIGGVIETNPPLSSLLRPLLLLARRRRACFVAVALTHGSCGGFAQQREGIGANKQVFELAGGFE